MFAVSHKGSNAMNMDYKILKIPFRQAVAHSQAKRHSSDSVLIIASEENIIAYGECLPRMYVSRENIETVISFLNQFKQTLEKIGSLNSLKEFMIDNTSVIDLNPAAWCACELAIIDFLAKKDGVTSENFLGLPPLLSNYIFSAVVPKLSDKSFDTAIVRVMKMGIKDLKFKITGNESDYFLDRLKELSTEDGIRLRADANNLWPSVDQCLDYFSKTQIPWYAVEEPLVYHGNAKYLDEIQALAEQIPGFVILDDSFQRKQDIVSLRENPKFIFNLRISKLGGILRTIDLLEYLERNKVIIGCHVGETSLLTRVALSLGKGANVIAREGAYSDHLLQYDPLNPNLKFGFNGSLEIDQQYFSSAMGYGMEYKEDKNVLK